MGKVFANIGVVAATCIAGHAATGGGWKSLLVGLALCIASNIGGLIQDPPGKISIPNPKQ